MGITIFNNMPIYTISKEDIERMGLSYNPTYFAKAIETWEEGEKKESLSTEEMNALKQKYNSNTMTRKDSVDLLGDLVKAGIMSSKDAQDIYLFSGCAPLDESKMQYGFLKKEYVSGTDALRDAWKEMNVESKNIHDNLEQRMGYDYYKTGYEISKMDTNIDDPDNAPYFMRCKQYLDILEALKA